MKQQKTQGGVVVAFCRPTPLFFILLAVLASSVHAQTPPDAGTLQRESERQLAAPPAAPGLAPPAPMKKADKGVTVTVKSFAIEGATLIPSAELASLLADKVGQSLTLAELESAAQLLATHYRQRSWFVRVYLPAQDVTDGNVRIRVIEGRLGGVRLDDIGDLRADAAYVQRVIDHRLGIGQPLSATDLERGLLLANDLPGIRATGILEAGDNAGETRLRVKVEDTPFLTADLGLNNHGVKATGVWQGVGGLALNNLSGRGDRLDLRLLAAEDLASGQLRYSHPLGVDGARLALRASHLRYRLGDSFAALDAEGRATTWGADISYPILRGAANNLSLQGSLERRATADDSLGAATRRHDIDALHIGLNGDSLDSQRGGLTQYNLTLTAGDLDLSGVAGDLATDQAGPRSQGRYAKLAGQIARLQRLPAGLTLHASLTAQFADGNLDSSEKFALGGPNALRAYPVNEASGDEGWLLKLELRKEIAQGWQAIGFIDSGGVRLHKETWAGWQGGSATPNTYQLHGAGLGLVWNRPGDWDIRLTVAAPLADNPGHDTNGDNNDGSGQHSDRSWLSASKRF